MHLRTIITRFTAKSGVAASALLSAIGWMLCCVLVFVSGNVTAQPSAPTGGRPELHSLSPRKAHKIRVTDKTVAEQIANDGGELIADYGSFQLFEVDVASARRFEQRGVRNEDALNCIALNAGVMDTSTAERQSQRSLAGAFGGKRLRLVQFAGPVLPDWLEALEKTGVRVISYIPNNAYLVYGDAGDVGRMQGWARSERHVQWDGEFADTYKIHPRARRGGKTDESTFDTDLFAIQLVDDPAANAATLQLIDRLKLAPVRRQFQDTDYLNVIVHLPPERLEEVAARPEVISIQPYIEPRKNDERQNQIIAGNLTGGLPDGPGYMSWLASMGFTQEQFTASGFVVDITDSGVDRGNVTNVGHFGLYLGGQTNLGSRLVYARLEGTANIGSTIQGCDGHGTINAHIIAGFNDQPAGFPHTDSDGYHYGLGVCPFVKIGSSVIFDPGSYTFPNFNNLQSRAYNNGARISANSWGAPVSGAYNADSQSYDRLVRDAQPAGSAFATAGNQQMVIVFAAGNNGSSAQTVGSPGTGKNVITVGASENVHSHSTANGGNSASGSDGCGLTDSGANSANDMATFSSRGPCADGRKKPDIVAPGTHVTGGVAQNFPAPLPSSLGSAISCFDGTGICRLPGGGTTGNANNFFPMGQQFYTTSSGTSHSTPAVAGAAALLRQYFINEGLTPPSPAMTKAFLMNSARYMNGSGANDSLWSNNQGMGELNMGFALDGVQRMVRDQLAEDKFTASGQTRQFTGTIANPSQPFRVTLAWTDAPGSTAGNAYNNNLDLTVTVNGTTYLGNVFNGPNSTAGGSADAQNNVESVFLPAGVSGNVVITVTAANINSDGVPNEAPSLDQDFALVIYNAEETTVPVIGVSGATVTAENCAAPNNAVDPNETVIMEVSLNNTGNADTASLLVRLLAANGITPLSGPQDYGVLTAGGGSVSRPFTFTATGNCGDSVTAVFQLEDNGQELGTITHSFKLGGLDVTTHSRTNSAPISIPATGSSGPASPFPSTISVNGVTGTVSKVTVTLRSLSHTFPDDLDILLVGPGGQKTLLMSDCGGNP
ncbi:MAG TPA: S8 family serine peptidase, partial [Verrucomicrobiota bacterium]|nr:S8 family serine peptidase [Verrucomicrobiota bacterium]